MTPAETDPPSESHPGARRRPLVNPAGTDLSCGPTDALLVAAGRGDLDAIATFYDRTAPVVFGMLRGVLSQPTQAERVTEGVYLHVWRTAPGFDPAGHSAWATLLCAARRALIGPVHDHIGALLTRAATDDTIDRAAAGATITTPRGERR